MSYELDSCCLSLYFFLIHCIFLLKRTDYLLCRVLLCMSSWVFNGCLPLILPIRRSRSSGRLRRELLSRLHPRGMPSFRRHIISGCFFYMINSHWWPWLKHIISWTAWCYSVFTIVFICILNTFTIKASPHWLLH